MKIIAHRGYWKVEEEKNSLVAFSRAFDNGYGVELDVRDYGKQLIVSHDVPCGKSMNFDSVLELYNKFNVDNYIAINIKSDGLQDMLSNNLFKNKITENYFVFDMSIPETIKYRSKEINYLVRVSEYEELNYLAKESKGFWLDQFNSNWINKNTIFDFIRKKKIFCIVSPELHGRKYLKFWEILRKHNFHYVDNLLLCTDYPAKAKEYFYEQN